MGKIKKKQLGGFGIDPSLGGLLNGIDLNNLNFAQVADLGSQIGGDPFNQAMAADDPTLYTNSIVGAASRDYATANNPLRTPDEIEEEAKRRTFLGIGKRRAVRKLEQENADRETLNLNTAGNNSQDSFDQFNSLSSLFNFIGNFEKGGKLKKMQAGGNIKDMRKWVQKNRPKLLSQLRKDLSSKDPSIVSMGIHEALGDMGYDLDNIAIDPKNLTDDFKKSIIEEYRQYLKDTAKGTPREVPEMQDGGELKTGDNVIEARHAKIKDLRAIDKASGSKITDKNNFTTEADISVINNIIAEAKRQDVDPYTVLAMALQETRIGGEQPFMGSTADNPLHLTRYYDANGELTQFSDYWTEPNKVRASISILKEKMDYAKRLKKTSEADIIQAWNGYGKLGTHMDETEGIRSWYGIPVSKSSPIDMSKNPVYGHRIIDLRDNVVKKSPHIVSLVEGFDAVPTGTQAAKYTVTDETEKMNLGGKAKLGYSDNSPFRNEPSIMIPSGNIDMSKTSMPILAIPDKGNPKVMQPKSGTHIFPDADSVMEIPMMKWGGKKKKKKIPYYQEGGQPVPAGVQLEDDEMIITPNMDIMETSARDTHKQMKSDVVTDIIRPEDYVLSNKLKINRKEAEKMSLGFGAMLYREGKIPDMPMEHTIADLFKEGEKSMTLAEYGKRVRKKLPVTDKEDPFSQKTNAANRAARLPYLAAAVYKNEMKRTKGKPEAMFESSFSNPFDTSFSSYAGMKEEGVANMALPTDVQQMQSGGPLDYVGAVQGLTNFATGIADSLFLAPKRAKITRKALEEDRTAINQLAQTQGAFSGAATGAALAGYSALDPKIDAPQYDSTQLEARVRKVPKTLFDYASGRAMAGSRSFQDSVFRNAGSFGQAVNAYSPVHAQNLGLLSNLGMQEVQQNIGLENQYRDKKQAFDDRQIYSDTFAKNATRGNRNSLTAGVAETLSGGITDMGSIEANRQNALRQNKLQQTQATLNASQIQQQGINNSFQNLGYAASTLPPDMFKKKVTPPPPSWAPPMELPNTTWQPPMGLPTATWNPYNPNSSVYPTGSAPYMHSDGLFYPYPE